MKLKATNSLLHSVFSPFLKIIGIYMVASLFTLSNLYAQDIQTKAVHFKKGQSSTTIQASITGEQIIDYTLNVKKGQSMNVSMATDNGANYFNIMEPNEDYVAIFNGSTSENMYEGVLQKSGNYKIRVYLMRSAARRSEKANYHLEIAISAFQNQASNTDAKVAGTNYHATGQIPCQMSSSQPVGNCDFGVKREGNGTAMVTITKSDGRTRIVFFNNGKATGYDESNADPGKFSSSKNADLYIIHIGNETYKIPEAVIFGG